MAPYLLQWKAIKIAKKQWSKLYDFLWVTSPWSKELSLSWVTDFKLKLTSDVREVSKSYIWINKKLLYNVIVLLKKLKNLLK
jgi:lipid II:glycine glycyltransferase (peptidoglycan interpeptide bridge formation enzyme)